MKFLTPFFAFLLFCLGAGLAIYSETHIAQGFIYAAALLGMMGIMCLMLGRVRNVRIGGEAVSRSESQHIFSIKKMGSRAIIMGVCQGLFLLLSGLFFYTIELISLPNPRIDPLEKGSVFASLATEPWLLGMSPWILYSVLGVSLSYFAFNLKYPPLFSKMIFPKAQNKLQFFMHNYCQIIVDTVSMGPYLWTMCLAVIWLAELTNDLMDWPSLFQYPYRTLFISGLILLMLNRTNMKLLSWMQEKKLGLGRRLSIIVVMFSFFLIWLHGTGDIFSFGIENTDRQVVRSVLVDSCLQVSDYRLPLLVWSWWLLWLPWMATLLARLSFGLKIWQALLLTLYFPVFMFGLGFHFWYSEGGWFHYFFSGQVFQSILQEGWAKFGAVMGLFTVILMIWGRVQSTADMARGCMVATGHIWSRPLVKSVNVLSVSLGLMIASATMYGWLPIQIISTLGAGFILTIAALVILKLLLTKDLVWDEAKYKVQESPEF